MAMNSEFIHKRVRNRVIELLDWLVECETTPPNCGVLELLNFWEDWIPSPIPENCFPEPVFTPEEELHIRITNAQLDAFFHAISKSIEDDSAALRLPEWAAVVAAAKAARIEMMKRGRMPEEEDPRDEI